MRRGLAIALTGLMLIPAGGAAREGAIEAAYATIVRDAAAGRIDAALGGCRAAAPLLDSARDDVARIWARRLRVACALLAMRRMRALAPPAGDAIELRLARRWASTHPPPRPGAAWPYALASAVVPGLGHALLGRMRDAGVAFALVVPMLALTLWAARRRMGPVTVFFAVITAWLWSGVVFSAYSLAQRGDLEAYLAWWRALWAASGLPGAV